MKFIDIKTEGGKIRGKLSFYCAALRVSRQGFYYYLKHKNDPWKYEDIAEKIRAIIAEDECNDTYGRSRMYDALKQKYPEDDIPGERTVYRIMQKIGLSHRPKRKPNGITKADKNARKWDDLLKRKYKKNAADTFDILMTHGNPRLAARYAGRKVLGVKGIDEYIRYGGTMSLGGINYNADTPFSDAKHAEEYIDTAIAKNIQHSLKAYQYGGHFRLLLDLYERGELTNVINRVVENINHSFTKSVIEHLNLDEVTSGIMKMLDILNKEDQSMQIEEDHMIQIKEYLTMLDLIMEIDLESLPEVSKKGKLTVITQPGLRYAQAEAIMESILLDEQFQELSARDRKRILDRLLSEISIQNTIKQTRNPL